jgi:predicted phosphatase
MKKYKVLKKTPKPIMNSNRMVRLSKGEVVYLKPEKLVLMLVRRGHLKEILELPKKKVPELKDNKKTYRLHKRQKRAEQEAEVNQES